MPRQISILFFMVAAVILGFVFYNYTETGNLSYTSIFIAIVCLLFASIMPKEKQDGKRNDQWTGTFNLWTQKALSIVLFVGAAALLGVVFYNYSQSGNMGYTSVVITLLRVSIGLILSRRK